MNQFRLMVEMYARMFIVPAILYSFHTAVDLSLYPVGSRVLVVILLLWVMFPFIDFLKALMAEDVVVSRTPDPKPTRDKKKNVRVPRQNTQP